MSVKSNAQGLETLNNESFQLPVDIETGGNLNPRETDLVGAYSTNSKGVVEIEIPSQHGAEKNESFSPESKKENSIENPFDRGSGSEEESKELKFSEGNENIPFEGQSINLDIKSDDEGEDTPTLPLNKKKHEKRTDENQDKTKEKLPKYIFPISRLKLAWAKSSNIIDFVLRVTVIVFTTLGWLCCVGGVPLMSLAMLIIGAIYINDCNVQPNIPVYLVVSGVFGTLQHIIAVWTKYIPKDSQGQLKVYRAYCKVGDYIINLFLFIWFILGCIWVYGVPEDIDFRDTFKEEYCHKTVYYFAFWMLNLSFIFLALLIVCTLFCILCIVISPKTEEM